MKILLYYMRAVMFALGCTLVLIGLNPFDYVGWMQAHGYLPAIVAFGVAGLIFFGTQKAPQ